MKWLERLIVKHFVLATAAVATACMAAVVSALFVKSVTLDQVSKVTDTLLKALAILGGALWSLNRYFTTRSDYPHLRVDATIDALPSTLFGENAIFGLLSYRLDIINTGKVLLPVTGLRVEVANVTVNEGRILYEKLYEWPGGGIMHRAGSIEPGSWAGISDAIACPSDVRAVRLFVEVELEKGGPWTWHRTLTTVPNPKPEPTSVLDARVPVKS